MNRHAQGFNFYAMDKKIDDSTEMIRFNKK